MGSDESFPVEEPQPATYVAESFEVIVECGTEARQREVFERISAEGFTCRLLTL